MFALTNTLVFDKQQRITAMEEKSDAKERSQETGAFHHDPKACR
jgi:hypothetical protein